LIYRNEEVTRREFSSIFWLCCLLGLTVLFSIWIIAPALSAIFKFSDLDSWIRIAAPIATLGAIGAPYQAFLEKDLRFKSLALIEVASGIAGLTLTAAWLLLGSPIAALIWGMMLKAAARTGLLLAVGTSQMVPELRLSLGSLRIAGRFGAFRIAEIAFGMMMHRADQLLVGYFLGQEALGLYAFAWQIAVEPVLRMYVVLTQVLFPGLSKIKADLARVDRVYRSGLRLIAAMILPIIAGIVVCSPVAVPMVFGRQWSQAVPLIEILSVVAAVCVVVGPSGSLLMSQGRSDVILYCTSGRFVLGCSAVIVAAAFGGLTSVAATVAGLYILFLLLHPVLLLQYALPDLRIGPILRTISVPVLLSCLAAVVALVVGDVGFGNGLGRLAIQGLVGAVVYAVGFLIVDRNFVRDSFALLALRPRAS
jgi:teichuronic acid exporter